jgi:hypothetical protein
MSRRHGSDRGFIGRCDGCGWHRLHLLSLVGDGYRPVNIDVRERPLQPLAVGFALLVGRRLRLRTVD